MTTTANPIEQRCNAALKRIASYIAKSAGQHLRAMRNHWAQQEQAKAKSQPYKPRTSQEIEQLLKVIDQVEALALPGFDAAATAKELAHTHFTHHTQSANARSAA